MPGALKLVYRFLLACVCLPFIGAALTCPPTFRYNDGTNPTCQTCYSIYSNKVFEYDPATQLCVAVELCAQSKGWTTEMIRSKATAEWSNEALNGFNMDREKQLYAAYVAMHGLSQRLLATDAERRSIVALKMFCNCIDTPRGGCPDSDKPGLILLNSATKVTRIDGTPLPFACMTHNKKIVILQTMEYLNHSTIPLNLQTEICEAAILNRRQERRMCPVHAVDLFTSTARNVMSEAKLKTPHLLAQLAPFSKHVCPTAVPDSRDPSFVPEKENLWIESFKSTVRQNLDTITFGTIADPAMVSQLCQISITTSFDLVRDSTFQSLKATDLLLPSCAHYNLEEVSNPVDWSLPVRVSHSMLCGQDLEIKCANIPESVSLTPEITGTISVELPAQDEDYLWLRKYSPAKTYTFLPSAVRCPDYKVLMSNTTEIEPPAQPHCQPRDKITFHVRLPDLDESLDYVNLTFSRIQGADEEIMEFTPRVIDPGTGTESLHALNVLRLTDTLAITAEDTTSFGRQASIEMTANAPQFKFIRSDPSHGPCAIIAHPVYSWSAISECGGYIQRAEYVDRVDTLVDLAPVDAPVFRTPFPATIIVPEFPSNSPNDVQTTLLTVARNYILSGQIQAVIETVNGNLNAATITVALVSNPALTELQCVLASSANVTFRLTAADSCGKSRVALWTAAIKMDSDKVVPIRNKPLIYKKIQLCHDPTSEYDGIAVDVEQLKRIILAYSRLNPNYVIWSENNVLQSADYYLTSTRTLGSGSRAINLMFKLTTQCGTMHEIQIVLTVAGPSMPTGADWCRSFVSPGATARFELANFNARTFISAENKKYVLAFVNPDEAVRVARIAGTVVQREAVKQSHNAV